MWRLLAQVGIVAMLVVIGLCLGAALVREIDRYFDSKENRP